MTKITDRDETPFDEMTVDRQAIASLFRRYARFFDYVDGLDATAEPRSPSGRTTNRQPEGVAISR